jgi:hypothetical protein
MRPLLLTFLLIVVVAATFLALVALGTARLNHSPAVVKAAPPPAEVDSAPTSADGASQAAAGLHPDRPATREPPAAPAVNPRVDPGGALPALPRIAGPIDLPAFDAVTHGRVIRIEPIPGGYAVSGWRDPEAYVEWDLAPAAPAPGRYRVELSFACAPGAGGRFVLAAGDDMLTGRSSPTGGPDQYHTTTLGTIRLGPGGTRLTLRPDGAIRGALMNLRHVRLVPA